MEILNIIGYFMTSIVVISIIAGIVLWSRGILPVLLRLGKGLATRKIAIFAEYTEQESLRNLLIDSGIFYGKNIMGISKKADICRAEDIALFLVHWPSWKDDFGDILSRKKDGAGLVVYAPPEGDRIPEEVMVSLNNQRNTSVTNFRGRLLGDILVSMMTTSFSK